MKIASFALLGGGILFAPLVDRSQAQPPTPAQTAPANLGQLMKGTLYPAANVVFSAQDENPADIKRARDPNMATDLLTTVYGKWEAVENSALAIAEVANLLSVPGRKCANGADVPIKNADWEKFVQELRDAGMAAYAAAKTKDQDKMTDVSGVLTNACGHCHLRYRERRGGERCK
jgi:hypothetical protein